MAYVLDAKFIRKFYGNREQAGKHVQVFVRVQEQGLYSTFDATLDLRPPFFLDSGMWDLAFQNGRRYLKFAWKHPTPIKEQFPHAISEGFTMSKVEVDPRIQRIGLGDEPQVLIQSWAVGHDAGSGDDTLHGSIKYPLRHTGEISIIVCIDDQVTLLSVEW